MIRADREMQKKYFKAAQNEIMMAKKSAKKYETDKVEDLFKNTVEGISLELQTKGLSNARTWKDISSEKKDYAVSIPPIKGKPRAMFKLLYKYNGQALFNVKDDKGNIYERAGLQDLLRASFIFKDFNNMQAAVQLF